MLISASPNEEGDPEWEARLNAVVDTLMQADLLKQIERQATEGVTCAEGQRVRNYFQSQIRGPVDEYWPEVIISYATGTRNKWTGYSHDLDGEGCGPGMMYCHLLVRQLARAGIPCFTGLHVEGGYNWHVYFDKLRRAKVMIVVMSPAFFKSAPCFHEQLEARKNGLQVIPLLFELEENGMPPGAVEGGGAKWIEACEKMVGGEDEQVAHDTLCAFRLRDDHETGLALNCEPAPPNTMLNNELLDKLVRRVKGVLGGSGAAGAAGAGEAFACSGSTLAASLSLRRPRKLPCRTFPSAVNSAKAISATSLGVTQVTPRALALSVSTGLVLRSIRFSFAARSSRSSAEKPVPTFPL